MPNTTPTGNAPANRGKPFGQFWDESAMTPGALRIIEHGRALVAEDKAEAKRLARNAKSREARAAKQAAYLAAVTTVVEPVVEPPAAPEPVVEPPAASEPTLPPVLVHGNYKLQTATGRVKYGNFEITEDLNAASLHVTPATLRRLPASPRLVNRSGTLHLTDAAMNEFKRVLS